VQIRFDTSSVADYKKFLTAKTLPGFRLTGTVATIPDRYAHLLGGKPSSGVGSEYSPDPFMFDYQGAITRMAIRRQKFSVFAACGLGKALIALGYAKHVNELLGRKKRVLIFTPPMVVGQMIAEAAKFYGDDMPVERVTAANLQQWLDSEGDAVGICNYEALKKDTRPGNLGALVLDESSILKSAGATYASICIRLGQGLDWKLCLTGTPAPNDRIEYANHSVFMDRYPTVNSFLASFFVNRGQTQNRWELKPHALKPFYRSLSDWCIFLSDPGIYGWKDNAGTLPPIHTHIHHVDLTKQQWDWVHSHLGALVPTRAGGIQTRGSYGQVAKGHWNGQDFETNKPEFMADLIKQWPEESTLVWCIYDQEQKLAHAALGGESLSGSDSIARRESVVGRFISGESKVLTSKAKILGFGLNLQIATRQVFSGVQDSYENYHQCVKRSNRVGSVKPLNVHIPVTELELPMLENVLEKADRVESDIREQEEIFKSCAVGLEL